MGGVCRLRYRYLENGIAKSRITISIGGSSVCLRFLSPFSRIESSNLPCKLSDICISLGELKFRKFTEYTRHGKMCKIHTAW